MRGVILLALALVGCATNGNGLIGAGGGASSGSITIIEPGRAPRTVIIR
ncbi:hypothetical protein V5F32_00720 [Xanthobacter oligotrophicus]|uniref:Argininosuccinate lyase n=1 Tax=Xanthobacter oligotrophicus TaxID=2607286 RepID=A0ABW6ZPN4_9HYPH